MRYIKESKVLIIGNRKFKILGVHGRFELFWDEDRKKYSIKLKYSNDTCSFMVYSKEEDEEVSKVLDSFGVSAGHVFNKGKVIEKRKMIDPLSPSFLGYLPGFPVYKFIDINTDIFIIERVLERLRELGYKTYWNLKEEEDIFDVSSIKFPVPLVLR